MAKGRVVLIVLAALIVILIAVLVGIAIGKHSNASSTSTTSSSSSSTSVASKSGSTSKGSTTTVAASCKVTVVKTSSDSAAGTTVDRFKIVNQSTADCTFNGYPSLKLVEQSSGSEVNATVAKGTGNGIANWPAPSAIKLAPNSGAYFAISHSSVNVGTDPCVQYGIVVVTPPGLTSSTTVVDSMTICSSPPQLSVSAITDNPPA